MNMSTFHKLSNQILNDHQQNKENSSRNVSTECTARTNFNKNTHISKDQIINIKRMNAKKIQEINIEKNKQIDTIKEKYQQQKKMLIQKYEKVISEKQEYIKVLQELYSSKEDIESQQTQQKKVNTNKQHKQSQFDNAAALRRKEMNIQQPFSQTLYLHQAPLYNDLCYTIQRPNQGSNKTSQFFSTQRIKSRLTSNQKQKKLNEQQSQQKFRSMSSTRNGATSKHGLVPACPPKYKRVF